MILTIIAIIMLVLVVSLVNVLCLAIMSLGVGVPELGATLMVLNTIAGMLIAWAIEENTHDNVEEN